ncbi:MAG: hypothetical protein V7638_135 [Acidobacteriota bacterium]
MQSHTFKRTHSYISALMLCAGVIVLMFSCNMVAHAQDDQLQIMPARGFQPAHSYSFGDIETISTTSGNLMLDIPLASLPTGRGGHPGFQLRLAYNSKIWNGNADKAPNPDRPSQTIDVVWLVSSSEGNWRYNIPKNYNWFLDNRNNHGVVYPASDLRRTHIWKFKLLFPDGSLREMRPYGYDDGVDDGYFAVQPAPGMSYFSTDGSYLRLDIGSSGAWTLNFPDGTKVVNVSSGVQRTVDKHGAYIERQLVTNWNGTGHNADVITDQLGRSIVVEYGTNEDYIRASGVGGNPVVTTVKWANTYVTKVYRAGNHFQYDTNITNKAFKVVSEIDLPAQIASGAMKYMFGYNGWPAINMGTSVGWGELNSVTLPSGATATYMYEMDNKSGPGWQANMVLANSPTQKDLNYTLEYNGTPSPAPTETWKYNLGSSGASVTAPDGGVTQEWFSPPPNQGRVYKVKQPDGSFIERIWKQNRPYSPPGVTISSLAWVNPFIETEFVSVPDINGNLILTSIKNYGYDKNGNLTQVKEYDWVAYSSIPRDGLGNPTGIPGGAPLKRVTTTTYHCATPGSADATTFDSETYDEVTAPQLLTAAKSNETGNGSQVFARTELSYDNALTTGNLIEQRSWDSTKGTINGSAPFLDANNSIATSTQYNQYGSPTLTTDARGVQTQIIYGFVGTFTDLYPTEIKTALGTAVQRWEKREIDFNTSLVTTVTDWDNSISTSTQYDDLGRPTLVRVAKDTPDEVQTSTQYFDLERRVVERSDLDITGDGKIVTIQHFDQLGRLRLTRQLEQYSAAALSDETIGIKVQRRYVINNPCHPTNTAQCLTDNSGVIGTYVLVSNPYRAAYSTDAGSESTMGWSRSRTDNAGRPVDTQNFAGSGLPAPWGTNATSTGTVTTSYDANFTTITDQSGKVRRNKLDGLGQVIRVDEPDATNNLGTQSAPAQATNYEYDVLGDLTKVIQGGQTRIFAYSSLRKLTSVNNPEHGIVSYEYDATGSMTKKTDPRLVPGTSTPRTTTYAYDQLGRVTSRTYNDGTPSVTYTYDDPNADFSKGQLTAVSSSVSSYSYGDFDAQGRVKTGTQTIDGQTYTMSYAYNAAGAIVSQTYPSGRVIKTNYDEAGRIAGVKNEATGLYYAGAASTDTTNRLQYAVTGAIQTMKLGNNLWERTTFNSRLQPTQIALGTSITDSSKLKIDNAYGMLVGGTLDTTKNNGNLQSQLITVPGSSGLITFTQTYTYDELNRLKSAEEMNGTTPIWKQTYLYDRFGNRRFDKDNTTLPAITTPNETITNPAISDVNNRISAAGYRYDSAGNLECDPEHPCGSSSPFPPYYEYDAENRLQTALGGPANGGSTYFYDGDGRRVKKVVGGANVQTTIFVYNAAGQMIAEYSDTPPAVSGATSYITADQLGTPRAITKADQTVIGRHDYQPFGEEIPVASGRTGVSGYSATDSLRQHFTGKERDVETKLDYFLARYYSSEKGRFVSPDPIVISDKQSENPQLWNLYNYAGNNPLLYTDPTGMEVVRLGQHTDDEIKKRKKEIEAELKNKKLTKQQKKALKAEKKTLELEEQGNKVVGQYLAALDKIGERNGMQVSDFSLTTEPQKDFATDPNFLKAFGNDKKKANEAAKKNKAAGMFVWLGYSTQIFVNAKSNDYKGSRGEISGMDASDFITYGGSAARHEKSHFGTDSSEHTAYGVQLQILQKFGPGAFKSKEFYDHAIEHVTTGTKRKD